MDRNRVCWGQSESCFIFVSRVPHHSLCTLRVDQSTRHGSRMGQRVPSVQTRGSLHQYETGSRHSRVLFIALLTTLLCDLGQAASPFCSSLHSTLPGIPPLEIPPGPRFDAPIKMKMLLRELNAFSHSVQFSCSVMSDSLRPMACSTPGFPVHHQLPELA